LRAALLHAAATAPQADDVTRYQFGKLLDDTGQCTAHGPDFAAELLAAALCNPQSALPEVRRDLLHRKALDLLNALPSPLAHIHGWSMAAMHQRWLAHVGFYQESEAHLRRVLTAEIAAQHQPGSGAAAQ